ncbi:MAG: vitamin K epoxide reductase family protein [Halapricum sp.]
MGVKHNTSHDYSASYSPSTTTIFGVFALVAVFGWTVTVVLNAIHYFAIPAIPPDAPVQGSISVITSEWAYVFGIPLATLGSAYYLTTLGLALWWFDTRHPLIIKILTPITVTGVLASAYFVWLQLVPIGAICPFCMMSAAASTTLLVLELAILWLNDTPPLTEMLPELKTVVAQTRYSLVVVPVLAGALTILGLYSVTYLPLPDPVPFV